MKGWIALDIDGTITKSMYEVPSEMVHFLSEATKKGWQIALCTGRSYAFASKALFSLPFCFTLLLQNGSLAVEMPEKEVLFSGEINREKIDLLEKESPALVVYIGYENGDKALYKKERFSKEDLRFVEHMEKREGGGWISVSEFDETLTSPLIKVVGLYHEMSSLCKKIKDLKLFQVSMIQDRFYPGYYILLITDGSISKGLSLKKLLKMKGKGDLVIAGGDDENDISLLQAADVRIAMPHAPESLRRIADFIAPPIEEMGMMEALKIVMDR